MRSTWFFILFLLTILKVSGQDSINAHLSKSEYVTTPSNINNDKNRREIKLNWELGIGQSYLTNSNLLANRLNTEFKRLSFNYYFSVSLPLIKNYDRLGLRIGMGPHLKTFGLNKLIEETNNKLIFMGIPDSTNIKTSVFQQLLIELPLFLYFETKKTKKGNNFSFECGEIIGIQAYNRWKTFAENNNVITTKYKENIPGTKDFQLGHSLRISYAKKSGAISSKLFIQGTFYSTNIFKPSVNIPTTSYDIKAGIQITANNFK